MPTTASSANQLVGAIDDAGSGSEIVVSGGTYSLSDQLTIATGGLTVRAADGETPTLDFQGRGDGVVIDGDGVTFRGFEVANSADKGINPSHADDVVVEDCEVHHSHLWGIMNNGGNDVVFRNCDSHHNAGNTENSDGFNMTGPASNGLIEGCRAWANGDDGFDMWISGGHTIRDCVAWDNGRGSNGDGNGFKLGGGPGEGGGHTVHNCVAYDNRRRGFDSNNAGAPLEIFNCTSVDNGTNFRIGTSGEWADSYTVYNCISHAGPASVRSGVDDHHNSWTLDLGAPQFRSTDPNSSDFLRLSSSSPCLEAGTDGTDLGAFPRGGGGQDGVSGDGSGDGDTGRITLDGQTTIAAADAARTSAALEREHGNYSGSGYVNFTQNSGATATWPLEVAAAGEYDLTIRYALGAGEPRSASLIVGDSTQSVTFEPTGSWNSWATTTARTSVPEGETDLTVETTGDDAGNVDQIAALPVEEGDSDDGSTAGDTTNHGYNLPEPGVTEWHVPLNENFESIDRDVPVVDAEGAREEYPPVDGALYVARDTGAIYVGDGSQWRQLGALV